MGTSTEMTDAVWRRLVRKARNDQSYLCRALRTQVRSQGFRNKGACSRVTRRPRCWLRPEAALCRCAWRRCRWRCTKLTSRGYGACVCGATLGQHCAYFNVQLTVLLPDYAAACVPSHRTWCAHSWPSASRLQVSQPNPPCRSVNDQYS